MKSVIVRSVSCLAAVMGLVAAFDASAITTLVDFENEIVVPPANVSNGFTSEDADWIHFSDTDVSGAGLVVAEFDGSITLAVLDDSDSGLLIELDAVASGISLDFGNTSGANLLDTATLTVLLGGFEVDSVSLELNLTDSIDQTIVYFGVLFDSAVFKYNVAGGLTEVVDNIQVTLPEPHAGLAFGTGALLVGAACGRRSPTIGELRACA